MSGSVSARYSGNGFFGLDASGPTPAFFVFLTNVAGTRMAGAGPWAANCNSCWFLGVVMPRGTRPTAGTYTFGALSPSTPGGEWVLTSSDAKVAQFALAKSGSLTLTTSSAGEMRGTVTMVGSLLDPITGVIGADVSFTADFVARCLASVATVPGVGCG
ncbi:MAG: hypothetical protein NVS4B3_24590 [Gemmatimonadaceae bacterium]